MAQDYNRLQRPGWDQLGAAALAREVFNVLNTATITRPDDASDDGFYVKFSESGSGASFAVKLQAGGGGWNYGKVLSGSQTTYRVQLHAGNTITATAPGVLVTDKQTIPANAQCVVFRKSDDTYLLVFAAWSVQS